MLKLLLSILMIIMSIFMLFLNHPLSMGLMILTQTLLICMLSGMMIKTYWFSYILFLTFMGGLLVLFLYVSSIASNELFSISFMLKMFMILSFNIMMLIIIFFNNFKWMISFFNSEMINFYELFYFTNNENKINLSKLYNNQTFLIILMMMIYLFITLLAVVKITNIFYGPIRSFN